MRRRIAALATAVALMLGIAGAITPSNAGTLCPPGCLVAGLAQGVGGVPDPTYLTISGSIQVLVNSRRSDAQTVASPSYGLWISGPISTSNDGVVSGTVSLHAYHWDGTTYDSFGGQVSVNGTADALNFNGLNLSLSLTKALGSWQGPFVSYG